MRRETLAHIGGFATFTDDLADDYVIGLALREAGHHVAIPPVTVAHSSRERTGIELWQHELRWARTIRVLDPIGFFGTILTYPIPFAAMGVLLAGFEPPSLWMAAAAIACRIAHCAGVARLFHFSPQPLWLVPIRDLLSFAGFLWSFVGGGVSWRGQQYEVLPDGTLVPARRPAT
jgi:ceramide glucosyltransferase